MTEQDEQDLKDMLEGLMHLLGQQQMKMLWVLETLHRMGAEMPTENVTFH